MSNSQLWWNIPVGYTEEAEAGGSEVGGQAGLYCRADDMDCSVDKVPTGQS